MTDKQNIEITPELLEEVRAAESAETIVRFGCDAKRLEQLARLPERLLP